MRLNPALTGSSPIIATARFVSHWAHLPARCSWEQSARPTTPVLADGRCPRIGRSRGSTWSRSLRRPGRRFCTPSDALKRAADYCRAGHGPAFVHAHVIRPYSHSLSDDERLYRPDSERQRDAARDPISNLQMFLLREGILDEKGINKIEKEVDEEVQAAADQALAAPIPQPDTIYNFVYSPDLDPTAPVFATTPAFASAEAGSDGKRSAASQPRTMADLINSTLRDEMRRDER